MIDKIDKQEAIAALDELMAQNLKRLETSLEDTRNRARDAPGGNQSHSDTSKVQLSTVALGLEAQVIELGSIREGLQFVKTKASSDSVLVGSLFTVQNGSGDVDTYLLLSKARGDSVSVRGVEVTSISTASPVGKVFLNRKRGERVFFRDVEFTVIDVV